MDDREFGRMMDGHLDPDVVSDLVGDVLTPQQAATLEPHLAECRECRELRDSLAEVRHLLATLPDEPMPGAVAARIEAALAAESRLRAGERDGAASTGAGTSVRSLDGARRRGEGRPRPGRTASLGQVAAAVALVATGSVIGIGVAAGLRDDPSREATSAGSGAADTARGGGGPAAAAAPQQPLQLTRSGEEYTEQNLAGKVRPLLTASLAVTDAPSGRKRSAPAAPGVESERATGGDAGWSGPVPACVLAATGRPGVVPLIADVGTYQGTPAVVLVLPEKDDAGKVEVFVVAAACQNGQGRLLASQEIPRP
jgi:hypothetical protein